MGPEFWLIKWPDMEGWGHTHLLMVQLVCPTRKLEVKTLTAACPGPGACRLHQACAFLGGWVLSSLHLDSGKLLHREKQGLPGLSFQPVPRNEASPAAANSCTTQKSREGRAVDRKANFALPHLIAPRAHPNLCSDMRIIR